MEIERARLIKKLAKIKEEQGLIAEAADLMQEIAVCVIVWWQPEFSHFFLSISSDLCFWWLKSQVETFGAMAKTEKIAFILEQVCSFLTGFRLFAVTCALNSLSWMLAQFFFLTKLYVKILIAGSSVFRPSGLCPCSDSIKENQSKSFWCRSYKGEEET